MTKQNSILFMIQMIISLIVAQVKSKTIISKTLGNFKMTAKVMPNYKVPIATKRRQRQFDVQLRQRQFDVQLIS